MKTLSRTVLITALFLTSGIAAKAQVATDYQADTHPVITDWSTGDHEVIMPIRTAYPTPGDVWVFVGNKSPMEAGDLFLESHVEQGFVFFRRERYTIQAYVAMDTNADTQHYVWANNVIGQGGVKLTYVFKHGVVIGGVARAYETQFTNHGISAGQTQGYFTDWFGWQNYTEHKFPGQTWSLVGNVVPVERNNLVMMTYVEQGYVVHRFTPRTALVPIVEETIGIDSHRLEWNNFSRTGAGLAVMLPHATEVDAVYNEEFRPMTGQHAGGFAVEFKFWYGWNLGTLLHRGN